MEVDTKVGDTLRDCDPRCENVTKRVIEIVGEHAIVSRTGNEKYKTKVRLNRIHDQDAAKKGYYNVTHAERCAQGGK